MTRQPKYDKQFTVNSVETGTLTVLSIQVYKFLGNEEIILLEISPG